MRHFAELAEILLQEQYSEDIRIESSKSVLVMTCDDKPDHSLSWSVQISLLALFFRMNLDMLILSKSKLD